MKRKAYSFPIVGAFWGGHFFFSVSRKVGNGDRESPGKLIVTVVFFYNLSSLGFIKYGRSVSFLLGEDWKNGYLFLFCHFSFACILFGGCSQSASGWQKF